ncbi:MAG TPA: transcription-repair coupling factor, partial [Verrucomicrobiaceae bacterium]
MPASPSPTLSVAPALIDHVRRHGVFADRLRRLRDGGTISLDHIAREAWAFAAALAVRAMPQRRAWILCADARTQEQVHADLAAWGTGPWFFPKLAGADDAAALTDPETQAERVSLLARMRQSSAGVVVLCAGSLAEPAPAPGELAAAGRHLQKGMRLEVDSLLAEFTGAGYERVPVVAERGQFARRGGIVDIFPWLAEEPLRVEFFDEDIESLRVFDIHTQTSVRHLEDANLILRAQEFGSHAATVADHIRKEDLVIAIECE